VSPQQQKTATLSKDENLQMTASELKAPANFSALSLVASRNPPSAFKDRIAYIYQPSRSVTQAGTQASKRWTIDFNSDVARWENRLMGWAGSRDPLQTLRLKFNTREEAILYAKEQGWAYEVTERPKDEVAKAKSYSDNFLYSPGKLKLIKTK
jgi:NADH dehydrogenase (ubiquinone) Fe-S protein 4